MPRGNASVVAGSGALSPGSGASRGYREMLGDATGWWGLWGFWYVSNIQNLHPGVAWALLA